MLKVLRNIGLVILVIVIIGWTILSVERYKGRNLPISAVDFSNLNNGTYIGDYAGGMLTMRANEVQVIVSSGKVTDIKVLKNTVGRPTEFTNELFDRVIKAQSLQVDTISGATICSKAYLKAVENALDKAEN